MRNRDSLSLPEEILLLALRDEEGTIQMESMYGYAVGGAVLAELVMEKRVAIDSGKKKLVSVVDAKPTGRPFLDDCLTQIGESKRRRDAQAWVSRFAQTKQLKHRLAQQLCDKGILRADEDKVLLLFTRRIYPEVDPGPERELIERMDHAIFSEDDRLDPRTTVIVSLANSAGLLTAAFDKKRLKARKRRLEQIANGDVTVSATKGAIEAMQTAVMVALIMPMIATI